MYIIDRQSTLQVYMRVRLFNIEIVESRQINSKKKKKILLGENVK